MPRSLAWLLVLVLLGAFGAVTLVLLRLRSAEGKGLPEYSAFSDGADGLGEAAHFLREAGWTPVAVTRPIQHTGRAGLLIVAEPERPGPFGGGGLGEADARALLGWVEQGNTVLLAARKNTPLHQALGVLVTEGPPGEEDRFVGVDLEGDGPYTEEVERLSVDGEGTLAAPARAKVLWRVQGRPGAVVVERGRGRVLVLAEPGLLSRRGLVRPDGTPRDDNAVFVYNVARAHAADGKVYFDEYHHGVRAGVGFWSYVGAYGRRWALLPLLAVALVALWRGAVRLGPGVPRPAAHGADAVDYASALARLYQQAGTHGLMARVLVRDFLGALTRHLRLRRTALPALILAAWRQQEKGPQAARLERLLRGVGELRKGGVSDRQLLRWAREFDEFKAGIQGPARVV